MPRINRSWFEFKGITSILYGIRIMDPDVFYMPVERVNSFVAAGRSGVIQTSEHAYDAFDIVRTIRIPMSQLNDVTTWLKGSGKLCFSYMGHYAYDARVNATNRNGRPLEFKRVTFGEDPLYEGKVVFTCQPFRYLHPPVPATEYTESGFVLRNPGNVASRPRVTIYGKGEFKVTIGEQTMEFGNVVDGILIDSALGDALTLDGKNLANNWIMARDLFEIAPGENTVTWEVAGSAEEEEPEEPAGEEETEPENVITKVVIEPRWRYL